MPQQHKPSKLSQVVTANKMASFTTNSLHNPPIFNGNHQCQFCGMLFKQLYKHTQHIHYSHKEIDCGCTNWCWTCNKVYRTLKQLKDHYRTSKHKLAAAELNQEMQQMTESPESPRKTPESPWISLTDDGRYFAYLQEIENTPSIPSRLHPKPRPWINLLRTQPVEIPLEATEKLPDPRLETDFSFLTLPGVTITIPDTEPPEITPDKPTEEEAIDDLVDTIFNNLTDTSPEDDVLLEVDEWLTIDSIGETANPEELSPPTDFYEL